MTLSHVRRCAALCALFVATAALSDNPPATSESAKPAKPAPAMEDRIQQALESRQPFECKDILVSELPAFLQKQYKIPVVLDADKIEETGKRELRFSLVTNDASLRSCLAILLRPHDLDVVITNEALLVTTREHAASSLRTEIFAVGDLTSAAGKPAGGLVFDEGLEWDEDSLAEIITATILPASWDAVGGAGNARVYRDLLFVSQFDNGLMDIKKLLTALRAAKKLDRPTLPDETSIDLFDPASKHLRAALDRKTALSVKEQPLDAVIRDLASKHQLPFMMDGVKLEEAGKNPAHILVSVDLADISLRSLLRHILGAHDLGVVVRNDHLWITTLEDINASLDIRVYPVRELLTIDEGPDADFEWLKELITITAQPMTWDAAGGSGTIREFAPAGALIVAQTDAVHEEMGQLMGRLRQVRQQHAAGKRTASAGAETGMVVRFYKIDLSRDTPAKSDFPPGEAKSAPSSAADVASLIRDLIEPESWKKEREAYLRAIGDRLVVRHRRAVHRQIERLIEKLLTAPTPTPTDNQIPMVTGAAF